MSPDKPTRERATESSDPRRLYDEGAGEPARGGRGSTDQQRAEGREEKGDAESSQKHPPHETEQDRGSGAGASKGGPVLPANAQGTDTVPTEEIDQPIREESMYDQRRDEDKDRPPSTR